MLHAVQATNKELFEDVKNASQTQKKIERCEGIPTTVSDDVSTFLDAEKVDKKIGNDECYFSTSQIIKDNFF